MAIWLGKPTYTHPRSMITISAKTKLENVWIFIANFWEKNHQIFQYQKN
jgi:hypothetical protein